MEVTQGGDPAADCVGGDPRFPRERVVHQLATRPVRQQSNQHLHLVELLHPRQVADVLPDQLPQAQGPPAPAEAGVALQERLRVAAVRPESVELDRIDRAGRTNDPIRIRKLAAHGLGDRERMHPIREVPPHQAVAAAAVDVQAAAPGDDDAQPVRVGVVQPLQERLPARELVQLVEEEQRARCGQPVRAEAGREAGRPRQNELPVVQVVPVAVRVRVAPARGGLADLARPADEGHLPVVREVVDQQRVVYAILRQHADHYP